MSPITPAQPLAVLCSDLHLSEKPPPFRAAEPDWFKAMARTLRDLHAIAEHHGVPIICAGDIFDRWNSSAKLINFALAHLPKMYVIAGQHDLPYHDIEGLGDSALGTLIMADKVQKLDSKGIFIHAHGEQHIHVTAFDWEEELQPYTPPMCQLDALHLLVAHRYVWVERCNFPGAPDEAHILRLRDVIKTYDAAHFGDNHKGFRSVIANKHVINTGGLMIRKSDEADYRPQVGILMSDGVILARHLDTSRDKYAPKAQAVEIEQAEGLLQTFLDELQKLGAEPLDFRDALEQYFKKFEVSRGARVIIAAAIDSHHD